MAIVDVMDTSERLCHIIMNFVQFSISFGIRLHVASKNPI
jgi:hypothetical protein